MSVRRGVGGKGVSGRGGKRRGLVKGEKGVRGKD